MRSWFVIACLCLALCCSGSFAAREARAQAALGYSPQRVLIGPRERSATLTLTNKGAAPASFRVGLKDVIYAEDGSIELVDEPPAGYPSARNHIRFSPSQVRLEPGESQRIRILVRTRDLPEGEYRVHAHLMKLPDRATVAEDPTEGVVRGAAAISQAVAIPIILRRGETSAAGGIGSASFSQDRKALNVLLERSGNQSLYVDLKLFRAAAPEGDPVGLLRGVAVPVPLTSRLIEFPLGEPASPGEYSLEVVDSYDGQRIATIAFR